MGTALFHAAKPRAVPFSHSRPVGDVRVHIQLLADACLPHTDSFVLMDNVRMGPAKRASTIDAGLLWRLFAG